MQRSLGSAEYQNMRSRVHSVGIDPWRDVVVSSSGMGHLLLWDVDGNHAPLPPLCARIGRVVDKVRTTVGTFRAFHPSMNAIPALQFRGHQHFVAAEAGGRVSLWNTSMILDGMCIRVFSSEDAWLTISTTRYHTQLGVRMH